MVDFTKRAMGTGDIESDEEVLGACNVTPSPFAITNAGMTGGLIAGGAAGMAVGAMWDRYLNKKSEEEAADQAVPALMTRQPFDVEIPANGALLAVTTKRLVAWRIAGLGKPREQLLSIPFGDIDEVLWDKEEQKLLRGKPASMLIWVGLTDRVLPMASLSGGPNSKYPQSVVAALTERLPGRVRRFEPEL